MSRMIRDTKQIIARLMSASISPLTIWFSLEMQDKLEQNRGKSGWDGMSNEEVLERIRDEVGELQKGIEKGDKANIIHEAADIANFCSFIAHNNQMQLDEVEGGE